MKNAAKKALDTHKADALEIIELATNDIESLAKAFNLIKDVCEHRDTVISLDAEIEDSLVH